jgi:hypothetical protein
VKENTKEQIDEYVRIGRPVGSFVRAVLENDLRESFGCADDQNREDLFDIVRYCHNDIPGGCWGSREKVKSWLNMHDERRLYQAVVDQKGY